MNNVSLHFAGKKDDLKAAVKGAVTKQLSGEKLAETGAKLVDGLAKVGLDTPDKVNEFAGQLQGLNPADVFAGAEALAKAKLGEAPVELAKQVATGNTEVLEAGLGEAQTRAGNLHEAVVTNLGQTAGNYFGLGAGLLLKGLQTAAELAAATPFLAPKGLEAAEKFVGPVADQLGEALDQKAAKARKEADLADGVKGALPGLAAKAKELLGAGKALFQPAEGAPKTPQQELMELVQKAASGADLTDEEQAKLAKLMGG